MPASPPQPTAASTEMSRDFVLRRHVSQEDAISPEPPTILPDLAAQPTSVRKKSLGGRMIMICEQVQF